MTLYHCSFNYSESDSDGKTKIFDMRSIMKWQLSDDERKSLRTGSVVLLDGPCSDDGLFQIKLDNSPGCGGLMCILNKAPEGKEKVKVRVCWTIMFGTGAFIEHGSLFNEMIIEYDASCNWRTLEWFYPVNSTPSEINVTAHFV